MVSTMGVLWSGIREHVYHLSLAEGMSGNTIINHEMLDLWDGHVGHHIHNEDEELLPSQ